MNLFLLIPAIVLLVLGVTRGAPRDWKRSILCLVLGATLFAIHHRRMVASAKVRAREWGLTHPEMISDSTQHRNQGTLESGGRRLTQ